MDAKSILDEIGRDHATWIVGSDLAAIDPWIEVAPDGLPEVCRALRDCAGAADEHAPLRHRRRLLRAGREEGGQSRLAAAPGGGLPPVEPGPQASDRAEGRACRGGRTTSTGELPEVPSVAGIWSTADWHEREVFDLMGVRFTGHPDLRRILCPEDWQGHPLRKDYQTPQRVPRNQGEVGRWRSSAIEPELVELDVHTDEMLINMGPQHPSTHGVLRLVLRTDGEVVSEVVPHIGYLHRCAEKIGENVSPRQWIPYTDRLDYLAAMNMNLGWAHDRREAAWAGRARAGQGTPRDHGRVGADRQPPGGRGHATGWTWGRSRRFCTRFASGRRFSICSRRRAAPG